MGKDDYNELMQQLEASRTEPKKRLSRKSRKQHHPNPETVIAKYKRLRAEQLIRQDAHRNTDPNRLWD